MGVERVVSPFRRVQGTHASLSHYVLQRQLSRHPVEIAGDRPVARATRGMVVFVKAMRRCEMAASGPSKILPVCHATSQMGLFVAERSAPRQSNGVTRHLRAEGRCRFGPIARPSVAQAFRVDLSRVEQGAVEPPGRLVLRSDASMVLMVSS